PVIFAVSQERALGVLTTLANAGGAGPGPAGRRRSLHRPPWLLLAILGIQAVLSLRLVWSNTAFQDEALYLWAGHVEWSHWLYGAPVPTFQTYFSGAPVVYPAMGALADTYGGLAAARLLSLCFMLGATSLLYHVTRCIFGRRSALFSAALFAGLGATQFLGAFATYDAMAIALLALATWLGIRAADSSPAARLALLVLAGSVLAVADVTKYAASLFDPVVIAAVAMYGWRERGRLAGIVAAAVPLLTLAVLLGAALEAGGHAYWHGVTFTTVARSGGDVPAAGILYVSAKWIGSVVLLALIGAAAVFAKHRQWSMRCMAVVLSGAVFLVPAEQARIHTVTSLFKHVGFGAWFGCIVGGFALAALLDAVPVPKVAGAVRVGLAVTIASAIFGIAFAAANLATWPNSSPLIARLAPVAMANPGPILEDNYIPQYYIPGLRWRTTITPFNFYYLDPGTGRKEHGPSAYANAIRYGYFPIIVLGSMNTAPEDGSISRYIAAAGTYRLAAVVPYVTNGSQGAYRIWVRATSTAGRQAAAGHDHRAQH
ncbi:MAG: glycosyltransferase family 39 protein, partial [Actinomycetota bacterium]